MEIEDKLPLTGHCTELMQCQDAELPELIRDAGGAARFAFEEFIHGQIRNPYTRKAYLHAVRRFSEIEVPPGSWTSKHATQERQQRRKEVGFNRVGGCECGSLV